MNYKKTIDYLLSLQKFGIKFGLSSTERLLTGLESPHRRLKCIHIAGTNGKGSVGASITSMLRMAGYKVGFYTSPHLVTFRERMVIGSRDGLEMIPPEAVSDLAARVKAVSSLDEPATFFEFVTAMALLYFAEEKVDLAIIETGLGGRLDATNIITPLIGVITNISLEHTEYLGPTLKHVAREKAGIIKPGIDLVTAEKRPALKELFEETAARVGATVLALGRDFRIRTRPDGLIDYYGLVNKYSKLKLGLIGPHQVSNAALALAVVELLMKSFGFQIQLNNIPDGLLKVYWPGRAEIFIDNSNQTRPKQAKLMLDGAHNPGGARALAKTLSGLSYDQLHLVMGIMADKDQVGIMAPLLPLAKSLYLTRPEYSRAASPETLAGHVKNFLGPMSRHERLSEAIEAAKAAAGPKDLILVTGSLFTVGEARAWLTGVTGP
ncbi:MAG: bifunctional folylpolyglutamate synthase/dihydrofolate synthase [Deltaproteobacteria bacterium]|nr:bifunctional folylpolyglutamate synthase/dihydrofolate synthase [Deltaproteobacteria bacterium]